MIDCSAMPDVQAFKAWDERAWVRRCSPSAPVKGGGDLAHPAVVVASQQQRHYLAPQHLYQWLRFTVHFEVSVVNRATLSIADGSSGATVPENASITAYKIYIDEGFHSLESLRVLRQVESHQRSRPCPTTSAGSSAGSMPWETTGPSICNSGGCCRWSCSRHWSRPYSRHPHFFSFLTFGSLSPTMPPTERRHHAYFATFFRELWASMDRPVRLLTGRLLPDLITESLQPATRPAFDALLACGSATGQARDIVADAYNLDAVRQGIRFAARRTIALFEDCGVTAGEPRVFRAAGLLT